jgi:hypothetical protein
MAASSSPALIRDLPGNLGAFARQLGERGMDVVAHQVQLVVAVPVGRMDRQFCGR